MRWLLRGIALAALVVHAMLVASPLHAQTPPFAERPLQQTFGAFLAALWPEAQAAGVSRATFDAAITGLQADLALPDLAPPPGAKTEARRGRGQAEFTRTPAAYLDKAQLAGLAAQGRALAKKHADALAAIEVRFGVERDVVLAIWGRETAFGQWRASHDVLRSLATLAWRGRRPDLFRRELIFALKLLEDGVVSRADMRGSWAGAMGLTQFMPSEFYETAQALNPGAKPDLFRSVPDALASAANQLKTKGWVKGQPWGIEVKLPQAVSCAREGVAGQRPMRDWLADGVTPVGAVPDVWLDAPVFLLAPAGARGPAFLAFPNFLVLKAYNFADLYALFVGDLANRIKGQGDFVAPWAAVAMLSTAEIEDLQRRLKEAGEPIEKIDGKAGMNTRSAIGRYQARRGLTVDCWPSAGVLKSLAGKP